MVKTDVDDAKREKVEPRRKSGVEVALVVVPKWVVGIHANVPEPEPQAVPVFEMSPVVENVAQPAVPPAEETVRFVVLAVPETVMAVVDANGNVEARVEVAVKMLATTPE